MTAADSLPPPAPETLKALFLLDPEVHFLNHGSFGATPQPVFAARQHWLERLERQPVKFLARDFAELMHTARHALAAWLGCAGDDLVYVANATFGVNLVARSLHLAAGDEVLSSDHEYGACERAWQAACATAGARYVRQPIAFPATSAEAMLEQLWQGVTPRTRAIFISHISSPTALRLPVEAICARARAAGLTTVIDAAHSVGQLPLDLGRLDADFVVGNLHKWALAPKSAAFLYARRERQADLVPLAVSWDSGGVPGGSTGSRFIDQLQWTGTHDPSPALAVPAALAFMAEHRWPAVGAACHARLQRLLADIAALTGLPPCYPPDSQQFAQMGVAELPAGVDPARLQARLYDDWRVEVPLLDWHGRKLIRISLQAYNTAADGEALLQGLAHLLPR
ncbi:MAG TPA: aminotransferase class V-fold PLP-dependent enzyme [Azonexus sp.]